jgi:hypothetical protein
MLSSFHDSIFLSGQIYISLPIGILSNLITQELSSNMIYSIFLRACSVWWNLIPCLAGLTEHTIKVGSSGGLPLSPSRPPGLQQQPTPAYNIQPTAISASATLVFSLPVSTTIPDLTISDNEFWKIY